MFGTSADPNNSGRASETVQRAFGETQQCASLREVNA